MIHSKTFVVDGEWLSVGSLNFDNRSLAYNDEANFVALDTTVGATMDALFMRDLERAHEIDLAQFRRRGLLERVLEFASTLVSSML
jgi:cardiolipin synthase